MRGMWVLPRVRQRMRVGVSPGENGLARKDGCSPDEYIKCNIIGLSLYTWLKVVRGLFCPKNNVGANLIKN